MHKKLADADEKVDLIYVNPQLIASAMPTENIVETLYHTKSATLHKFLTRNHGTKWHIWNLQEDHELGYDPANFAKQSDSSLVTRVEIPDHNPTSFARLIAVVQDIHAFISQDPGNCALVHCKCGKGRTGTVCVSYMILYDGLSCDEATEQFSALRIRFSFINGISISSQLRYVHYVDTWKRMGEPNIMLQPHTVQVLAIVVNNATTRGCSVQVEPLTPSEAISQTAVEWQPSSGNPTVLVRPTAAALLPADIRITYTAKRKLRSCEVPTSKVYFSFNALFEDERGLTLIAKDVELDLLLESIGSPDADATSYYLNPDKTRREIKYTIEWRDTDGFWGSMFSGEKAFDSIDVYYTILDPTQ